MKKRPLFKRGDIVYVEKFGKQIGSEQFPGRPAIVVSSDEMNGKIDTVEIVYCTTQPKEFNKCHVEVMSTPKKSTVLCEQVTTVDKKRLDKKVGRCTDAEMEQISRAIASSLKIDMCPSESEIIRIQEERDTYKEMYEKLLKEISTKGLKVQDTHNNYQSGYKRAR